MMGRSSVILDPFILNFLVENDWGRDRSSVAEQHLILQRLQVWIAPCALVSRVLLISSPHFQARPSVCWMIVSKNIHHEFYWVFKLQSRCSYKFRNDGYESLSEGKWIDMKMGKKTRLQKVRRMYFNFFRNRSNVRRNPFWSSFDPLMCCWCCSCCWCAAAAAAAAGSENKIWLVHRSHLDLLPLLLVWQLWLVRQLPSRGHWPALKFEICAEATPTALLLI